MQKDVGIICKQDQMEEFTGINNVVYVDQKTNGPSIDPWGPSENM